MAGPAGESKKVRGGGFLFEERGPEEIFTPEDFSEEHRAIARTAAEFFDREVEPNVEAIQRQEPGAAVRAFRKAAELGLAAVSVPEEYGGMEMDLVSDLVVAEQMGRDGSYAAWHGAHTGIGTWPILLFGTEEQKRRWLPRLAGGETIAAYALSEPQAGSDALAARTRADWDAAAGRYLLNGQKMWITNGGAAGLFIVFAKIGGEKFTAFLVERDFPGVGVGAEEKKMGIKGSSTTPVYFDNAPVPPENVLGEPGRGHVIAFNILNLGRLKLGPFVVGGAKSVLARSLRYARQRQAFGKAIAEFGLIRHKLAEMAVRIFAAESVVYRTAGLIESLLPGETLLKAAEEFAPECSIVKVFASEMLDYVVDEGVQIHGGYGYHQDYAVERAYRDSRINRIFEGTNEINRLLTTGMLLKRAERGHLPLAAAAQKVMAEVTSPAREEDGGGAEARLVRNAKKIALFALGVAWQRHLRALEEQQEVMAGIADIIAAAYAMESVLLREKKMGRGEMGRIYLRDAMAGIEAAARNVLAACAEGDALRIHLAVLRRLAKFEPVNAVELRRGIAARLLEAERYVV